MSVASISFKIPPPTCGAGMPLSEGCDIPTMRPRTGPRGTDAEMVKVLESAMEYLASSICSFWACEGPRKPRSMCTCGKCYAMREIGTVIATLKARTKYSNPNLIHDINPQQHTNLKEITRKMIVDLQQAIAMIEPLERELE